jgi:hypothetical protein
MENEDKIILELKQINMTLNKLVTILSPQTRATAVSTNKSEIEDRIRQARLEAEERVNKLKMRSQKP